MKIKKYKKMRKNLRQKDESTRQYIFELQNKPMWTVKIVNKSDLNKNDLKRANENSGNIRVKNGSKNFW